MFHLVQLKFGLPQLVCHYEKFVLLNPGNTLLTVIAYPPNSTDNVFAQLATAALIVLETPKPGIGAFTEVEIIFIILPNFSFFIPSTTF